jgi:hypothetical protein
MFKLVGFIAVLVGAIRIIFNSGDEFMSWAFVVFGVAMFTL